MSGDGGREMKERGKEKRKNHQPDGIDDNTLSFFGQKEK